MAVEIKPITTWVEKDDLFPEGTLRLYIGNLLIGRATPLNNNSPLFTFDCYLSDTIKIIGRKNRALEEIIFELELAFKELLKQIQK